MEEKTALKNALAVTRCLVKKGFPPIPVPRHKGDIPKGTLKNILKAAGLGSGQ